MLSTFHNDNMIGKRKRTRAVDGGVEVVQKPKVIEDYNMIWVESTSAINLNYIMDMYTGNASGGRKYFFTYLMYPLTTPKFCTI